ncbi:hypothetical protein ACSFA0_22670 [Variovorax sp. LT1P1]|uniref:hypothetical protein n=1 Tax=Variovorax sp. LT1P1 TaxID=3443730 RepID=UPI003F479F5C
MTSVSTPTARNLATLAVNSASALPHDAALERAPEGYSADEAQAWMVGYNQRLHDLRAHSPDFVDAARALVTELLALHEGFPNRSGRTIASNEDREIAIARRDAVVLAARSFVGIDSSKGPVPAPRAPAAAISFATSCGGEGLAFLRSWQRSDWDGIRKHWPDAPAEVFPATAFAAAPENHAAPAATEFYVFWSANGQNIRLWTQNPVRAQSFADETGLEGTTFRLQPGIQHPGQHVSVQVALQQIIAADDAHALTQQLIDIGRRALAAAGVAAMADPGAPAKRAAVRPGR